MPKIDNNTANGGLQMRLHIGATILIVLGVLFLLVNLDVAPAAEIKKLLATWWPLLLIIVGVSVALRPRRHTY
jgi:hypothetical protein